MKSSRLILAAALFLASCAEPPSDGWLGYVESEPALIAAPQGGWLTAINVARGATVNVGDTLFVMDAERETASRQNADALIEGAKAAEAQGAAALALAQARRAEVEALVVRTARELERQRGLVAIGASPRRDFEAAQAAYDGAIAARDQTNAQARQAGAQVEQARAQQQQAMASVATADKNLSERQVQARIGGKVENVFFRAGEYASPGIPVISILPQDNVFVRFFIPETELARVQLGSRVNVTCDNCPDGLTATISFIATEAEFTPPIIYSVTNRQKLVFKAEARAPDLTVRPGLPVSVTPAP